MKIKIAHIQLLPLLSGVQRVSLQEFERLGSDYDVFLICKEPGPLSFEAEKLGVHVFYVNSLCREISIINDLKSLLAIYRIIKSNGFDIVHSHSSKTGLLGRLAAKLARVPLIIHTVHGFPFDGAKNSIFRFIYKVMEIIGGFCSDKIICLHQLDKDICVRDLFIKSDKISIIPNGVDINKFKPLSSDVRKKLRDIYNIPVDAIVYIMVGRLWKQKNPMFFLDAAIKIIDMAQCVNPYFLIVGDGELRKDLESECNKKSSYSDLIKFIGWRDDVANLLGLSDVFVLPSLWEGMPLAILEAQACGLPCLVSDIPGNKDLVSNGLDGFLFKLSDSDNLVHIINHIHDSTLIDEFSLNARNKIVNNYDIEQRVEKIKSIYSNV